MSAEATKTPPAPESPTTARPLEMDDDDVQETGASGTEDAARSGATTTTAATAATTTTATATTSDAAGSAEVPPPKPPRPLTEEQKKQQTLKEAFPTVDDAVIRAVLRASGGRIEAAFNALLEMTDPDAVAREQEQEHEEQQQPPPRPPRPAAPQSTGVTGGTPLTQLEADELYARQLAEHYESVSAYEARTANRHHPGHHGGRPPHRRDDSLDREHSFIDDDLPVIKESLRKGFFETQTKVNAWFNNLKKKIDETFDEEEEERNRQNQQAGSSFLGRPTRDQARRSADYDRYDADPELLSDDFAGMRFHSDGTPVRDPRSYGGSNPNLFKPPPPAPSKSPRPGEGRKVSFRDAVEDIDAYQAAHRAAFGPGSGRTSPGASAGASSGGAAPTAAAAAKSSKWQPLSPVDPNPIAEAENDPFSLGDSDDERDLGKDRPGTSGGIKMEDTERLKQATADAMAESLVEDKNKASGGSKDGGK
ncbi:hypothetical protein VTJ83DRAFT_6508 [Remersonia thermophila]|uniref:CUE domain-containing protein n=1 Tax=Remersonia thermophila TaxID=72144 RepID=A0ABR4D4Y8_9PEZI